MPPESPNVMCSAAAWTGPPVTPCLRPRYLMQRSSGCGVRGRVIVLIQASIVMSPHVEDACVCRIVDHQIASCNLRCRAV
jgi:hypothetical protein